MSITEVSSIVKSCVISRKGGILLKEINDEYNELVGERIPFSKLGFASLEKCLLSLSGIHVSEDCNGNKIITVKDEKTAHIAALVNKQKSSKVKPKKKSTVSVSTGKMRRLNQKMHIYDKSPKHNRYSKENSNYRLQQKNVYHNMDSSESKTSYKSGYRKECYDPVQYKCTQSHELNRLLKVYNNFDQPVSDENCKKIREQSSSRLPLQQCDNMVDSPVKKKNQQYRYVIHTRKHGENDIGTADKDWQLYKSVKNISTTHSNSRHLAKQRKVKSSHSAVEEKWDQQTCQSSSCSNSTNSLQQYTGSTSNQPKVTKSRYGKIHTKTDGYQDSSLSSSREVVRKNGTQTDRERKVQMVGKTLTVTLDRIKEPVTEPMFLDYQLMGDDFLLNFAYHNLQSECLKLRGQLYQCGLCVSQQTIRECRNRVLKSKEMADNVILLLGCSDLMKGSSFLEMKSDMIDLINILHLKVANIVVLTLPPIINLWFLSSHCKTQFHFNQWLMSYDSDIQVIDIWSLLSTPETNICFEYFESLQTSRSDMEKHIVVWNSQGRRIVMEYIKRKLVESKYGRR